MKSDLSQEQLEVMLASHVLWDEYGSAGDGACVGKRADFTNMSLHGLSFVDAVLRNSVFNGSRIEGCNLNRVNMDGASMSGASVSNSQMQCAQLTGATLDRTRFFQTNMDGTNFTAADLVSASFCIVQLKNTRFAGAVFDGVEFNASDLENASITWTALHGVDFTGSNLSGANFSPTGLTRVIFPEKDLRVGALYEVSNTAFDCNKTLVCLIAEHGAEDGPYGTLTVLEGSSGVLRTVPDWLKYSFTELITSCAD
jgi:uncharacterized protein YjbI with pentapeptide repeats